jgi:hypothetical protein
MERAFNRYAVFALAFLFLFAFWGFWPTYFSRPFEQANWRFHFHGLALVAWCVLMVSQAYFIRAKKWATHRKTGRLSFLVAPLVVVSIFTLAHYRLATLPISDFVFYGLALATSGAAQFAFAYGMAIYHRSSPQIHARFMICTAIALIPPIFDRIMIFYLLPPERAQFLPQIGGDLLYPLISFAIMDVLLVLLAIWDWRSRKSLSVFPVVLAVWIGLQGMVFTLHLSAFWRVLTEWFLGLPFS